MADRLGSYRRTVTATVALGVAVALCAAALATAVYLAVLVASRPVLAVLALAVAAWLVLRRGGGLALLAAVLWRLGGTFERRAR